MKDQNTPTEPKVRESVFELFAHVMEKDARPKDPGCSTTPFNFGARVLWNEVDIFDEPAVVLGWWTTRSGGSTPVIMTEDFRVHVVSPHNIQHDRDGRFRVMQVDDAGEEHEVGKGPRPVRHLRLWDDEGAQRELTIEPEIGITPREVLSALTTCLGTGGNVVGRKKLVDDIMNRAKAVAVHRSDMSGIVNDLVEAVKEHVTGPAFIVTGDLRKAFQNILNR